MCVGNIKTWEKIQSPRKPLMNCEKEKYIGQGTYGKMFLVSDMDTGRKLAMKEVFVPDGNNKVSKEVRLLQKEIDLLAKLRHERIVKYYVWPHKNNTMSIFLEFMPGGSVANEIEKYGPLTEAEASKYTRKILQGLDYLHEQKLCPSRRKTRQRSARLVGKHQVM